MAELRASERERAMVDAYRRGKKVSEIEAEFEVGRSTLYHVLKRAGVTPSRSNRQLDAASSDARMAGIAELILHQDRVILELQEQVKGLERQLRKLGGPAPRARRSGTAS